MRFIYCLFVSGAQRHFFCDFNIEDLIQKSEELPEYSTHTAAISDPVALIQ
jgi:hypothetical protein